MRAIIGQRGDQKFRKYANSFQKKEFVLPNEDVEISEFEELCMRLKKRFDPKQLPSTYVGEL